MNNEIYVSSVVDVFSTLDNSDKFNPDFPKQRVITKGKNYKVENVVEQQQGCSGTIINDVGGSINIMFGDSIPCVYQNGESWKVFYVPIKTEETVSEIFSWSTFISKITIAEAEQIVQDYEKFKKDGFIGDSLLRRKASEWGKNIHASVNGVWMNDIAFNSYVILYKYYRNEYERMFVRN